MKRALIIILAVAVLGVLALASDKIFSSRSTGQPTASNSMSQGFKDGTFQGSNAETPYGHVQISVVIKNGKISDVQFLKMPSADARSRQITSSAKSRLESNTLRAQGPNIDFVSGATSTSFGYQESLQAALDKASASAFILMPNQNI